MKRKVWIFNHYATNMFFDKGGRHYWFAKHLIDKGYEPTIFCANTGHNSSKKIDIENGKTKILKTSSIPYVFIKTKTYKGNGLNRIINILSFYKKLFPVTKKYYYLNGKPDVIIASSFHPLALIAGIKIAKKFRAQCICEIRDLWPESLVTYGSSHLTNILSKLLYIIEKWIYKKADKLIFTMEGGKDYIIEKGWDKKHGGPVDIEKVYHINNGVDLDDFEYNNKNYKIQDYDLENDDLFKVVYTGSIRKVNKVGKLLDVAKIISDDRIRFLIWGDGSELKYLKKRIVNEKINNVRLKGRIDKKYVPYITNKAQLNVVLGDNISLFKYGVSMNKLFDYLAAEKPILLSFKAGYSLIERYNCGVELEKSNPENIAKEILRFKKMDRNLYEKFCTNSRKAAEDYDFKKLTNSLVKIIEKGEKLHSKNCYS